MKEKALREKAIADQQRAANRQGLLQQVPVLGGVLSGAFINSGLGAAVTAGSRALASSDSSKSSGPSSKSKPLSGLFGGALNLGQQLTGDLTKMGKTILNGNANVAAIAKALPPSLLSAAPMAPLVTSVLRGVGAPSGSPQRADDRGGWLGNALNFGNNLVNQAKSFGQSALQFGSNAWNGAAQWVNKHKAEIAIGVGVVALAAATIATGGAALAVAGAVGAGGLGALATGSTLAALGTVAAGGFIGGAGLNLARQGAQIKDGMTVVDPTTGKPKPKTDIDFGSVFQSGATGAVMAPVGAIGFGLAPVVVGGLGVAAAGTSAINAYNNFTGNNFLTDNNPNRTKNNWAGALDVGEGVMAALPFASKKGRTEMFGAEARARTLQTGKQLVQGVGNLASRAWNGARNVNLGGIKNGAIQAFNGVKALGAQGWASTKNFGSQAITGVKNLGIRALNAADNLGYQAKVLAAELSPGVVTPDGTVMKPIPEPPTPRPLIEPQKNQPMRMQGNSSEGGAVPSAKPKSLDELRVVNPKKTGDFSDISGESVQEVLSRVPEGATMRKLTPVEGGSQVGVEYKWVDENGVTNRLRVHDMDPSAPANSNAAQGWVARYQVGGKYYDPEVGSLRPRNVHKPESPHYDPKAANDTHIPIQTPDEGVIDLMRFKP